jgi:glycosyltransferase involved in cell wall biosynthesis
MTDTTLPRDDHEENLTSSKQRIAILEQALQYEIDKKSALEYELREIKNSIAWASILKFRGLRDRFLPPRTRRRCSYDFVKSRLRVLISRGDSHLTGHQRPESCGPMSHTLEIGAIDSPLVNELLPREPLWIKGWAVPPAPLARVDIMLDGEIHGSARPGVYRPELEKVFPGQPDAIVSGFEYLLDLTTLPRERSAVTLGAIAYSVNGSRHELSSIAVRVGRNESKCKDYDKELGLNRTKITRSVPDPRADKKDIRLLVFTHHLGYGGGQLYLYELLRRLSCEHDFMATVVAPDDGPLRAAIEDLGITVHLTHGYPHESIEMFEGKIEELVAWARPQGFDVVLVNTVVSLPGPAVAICLGIPFVWAIHESWKPTLLWSVVHPPPGAHPQVRRRITDALGNAAAVVFEADATRRQYQPYGDSERFIVISYGIDVDSVDRYKASFDRVAARRRLGIPTSANAILCMSIIEARKAQILLAEAFWHVADAHPEAFLILVGDTGSPYANVVRSFLSAVGLEDRVLIVPVVPEPYEWYASADLLVCPSDVESLPRCVLEAMAFEVPVLATAVFGLPELIKDGETGYLCRPCDLAALTTALERVLCEDKNARRQIARNGANLVRMRHDSRAYANAYLRLLRGLIRNCRAMPGDLLAGKGQPDK